MLSPDDETSARRVGIDALEVFDACSAC